MKEPECPRHRKGVEGKEANFRPIFLSPNAESDDVGGSPARDDEIPNELAGDLPVSSQHEQLWKCGMLWNMDARDNPSSFRSR